MGKVEEIKDKLQKGQITVDEAALSIAVLGELPLEINRRIVKKAEKSLTPKPDFYPVKGTDGYVKFYRREYTDAKIYKVESVDQALAIPRQTLLSKMSKKGSAFYKKLIVELKNED